MNDVEPQQNYWNPKGLELVNEDPRSDAPKEEFNNYQEEWLEEDKIMTLSSYDRLRGRLLIFDL